MPQKRLFAIRFSNRPNHPTFAPAPAHLIKTRQRIAQLMQFLKSFIPVEQAVLFRLFVFSHA
jgi:hypothetical protein